MDNIIDGNEMWPDSVLKCRKKIIIGEKEYVTYQDLPVSMTDALDKTRKRRPEKCCIVDDNGEAYTYRQFWKHMEGFASLLYYKYHVRKGTHVGILLYNSIEFCVSVYALNRLGAVVVPLSTKYRKPEISSLVHKADLEGIIYHKDFANWFRGKEEGMFHICVEDDERCSLPCWMPEAPGVSAKIGDTAIMMFTSGTTSRSKGVLMKNFNVMHAIAVYQKIFSITEDDRSIIPIPAYHVTGLVALLGLFFYSGGCLYLHKFFDAERVLKEVHEHRLTFIHASPTVFSMLLDHRKEYPGLPSVRILACGSSNMPGENIREFHRWMPQAEFRTIYGLTETTSPATIFPEGAALSRHLGSSGRPIPGLKFMICDEYQHPLGPRRVGSIYVEGTTVTTGYYKMSSDMYLDGFLDTGDLGYFDEDGYLYVVDRKKDMINRGGEKICSFDVENALYTIQEIREAAVVGIPDTRYGEVPAAMVVQKEGSTLSEDEIRKILNTHLAKFQIPVKFRFVESLPLTPNMKVDKRKIREIMSNDQN